MITVCLLITVAGIAVICLSVSLWDTIEPAVQRITRKIKRGLCARWLAEDGMTATPLHTDVPELEPVHAVSADDLLRIINEM